MMFRLVKYLLLIGIFTILGVALVLSVGLLLIPNTNYEQEIPLMFLGLLVGNSAGVFLAWQWYKKDKRADLLLP